MSDPGKDICPIGIVEDAVKRPALGGYIRKLAHRKPESVRTITVIQTRQVIGTGTQGDPIRYLHRYYDNDGEMLAEHDSWKPDQEDQEGQT